MYNIFQQAYATLYLHNNVIGKRGIEKVTADNMSVVYTKHSTISCSALLNNWKRNKILALIIITVTTLIHAWQKTNQAHMCMVHLQASGTIRHHAYLNSLNLKGVNIYCAVPEYPITPPKEGTVISRGWGFSNTKKFNETNKA